MTFFNFLHILHRIWVNKGPTLLCKQDIESVKVAPESVLSNRGNLEGTHLTRFSPGGGVSPGGGYLQRVISVHRAPVLRQSTRNWKICMC